MVIWDHPVHLVNLVHEVFQADQVNLVHEVNQVQTDLPVLMDALDQSDHQVNKVDQVKSDSLEKRVAVEKMVNQV